MAPVALAGPARPFVRLERTLAPLRAPITPVDRVASRRLARCVGARDRDCYRNSIRALPWTGIPDACYVEGLVVIEYGTGVLAEHGWIERPDGVVLDPTPGYCAENAARRVYFPLFRLTREELRTRLADVLTPASVTLPFVDDLPGRGRSLPEWSHGQLAAWRHLSAVHEAQTGVPRFTSADEQMFCNAVLGVSPRDGARD